MLCFRDMTFCIAICNTVCPIKLTPQVEEAATEWWGSSDAPIAHRNFMSTKDTQTLDTPHLSQTSIRSIKRRSLQHSHSQP
jgi:hypothetical protein